VTVHFVSHYDQIFKLLFPDFESKTTEGAWLPAISPFW
jgi:hypothetical protein